MENIQNKILDIINNNMDNTKITIDQYDEELSQFGMDSLKFISIVVELEKIFDIEIPDEKLFVTEMGTINKIVSVVSSVLEIAS